MFGQLDQESPLAVTLNAIREAQRVQEVPWPQTLVRDSCYSLLDTDILDSILQLQRMEPRKRCLRM